MKELSTANINARITEKLSAEICPVHGKNPIISWNGNNMQARCCCNEFRTYIDRIAESVAKRAAQDEAASLIAAALLDDCDGE